MKELYKELLEREEYLMGEEQTEKIKTRLNELSYIIVRVQQLLLPIVSSTFICECRPTGSLETKTFTTCSNCNKEVKTFRAN